MNYREPLTKNEIREHAVLVRLCLRENGSSNK